MKTQKYKMRAECMIDAGRFIQKAAGLVDKVIIKAHKKFPDVTIEFSSSKIDDVKFKLTQVVDGHVMYETLMPVELYTGSRG